MVNFYLPWLVWVFPFAGAMLTPALARAGNRTRDFGAVAFSFLGALSAALLLPEVIGGKYEDLQLSWIPSLGVKAGVLVDPLSILMANVVAWISFLIMVYSVGYMHGDAGLTRYWFFMNLFIGNMLLLVMSDNLLQLLFGWEGVGLCSYALIGFWYRDEPEHWVGTSGHTTWGVPMAYSPSHAGMKAFIMTRVGDIGLLIAIFLIYSYSSTFNFVELSRDLGWAGELARTGLLLPVAILFFLGPIGKSAQIPLHEWLPDAMAGPTAVSALIHAATMVKAGVFLVARGGPVFFQAFVKFGDPTSFFEIVAWIGAITAFVAATQAAVSSEIKKVLAYSTVSQIGYMMLGLGVAGLTAEFAVGYAAGFFHLVSHAIFKAAGFMAAGAMIHACESRFIHDMGGLRHSMRFTFIAMLLAMASLSGIPPLSGFWSKDAVLAATFEAQQFPLLAIAMLTVALTFFYSLKVLGTAFGGVKSKHLQALEAEGKHIHEASRIMYIPYLLLAGASLVIGLLGPWAESWLEVTIAPRFAGEGAKALLFSSGFSQSQLQPTQLQPLVLALSFGMLAVGGVPAYYLYVKRSLDPSAMAREGTTLGTIFSFLWNRWYVNPAYYRIFIGGTLAVSQRAWRTIELGFFDRLSGAFSGFTLGISGLGDTVDFKVVDRFINAIASAGSRISARVRLLQTGVPQNYVLVFAAGLLLLVVVTIFLR